MGTTLPKARTNDLVESAIGDQVVVYDQATHQIHRLNSVVSTIWELCDGTRSVEDISHELPRRIGNEWSVHTIVMSIEQLDEAGLLEPGSQLTQETHRRLRFRERRISRRTLAAGGIAVPMILSTTASAAAGFTSPTDSACRVDCNSDAQCSGCCSKCHVFDSTYNPNPVLVGNTCYNPNRGDEGNPTRC
jgi:hypothetical protein